MQTVAEFVEQGNDLVVREHGRLAADRTAEVAGQVGNRGLDGVTLLAPRDGVVHPGTTALAVARVQVDVELADELAGLVADGEEFHRIVPDRRVVLAYFQPVKGFDELEQAGQDRGFGEILLHLLFGEGIARLAQLFGGVTHVPCLQVAQIQFLGGILAQFRHVALGIGLGAAGKRLQEIEHLGRSARHLWLQRQFGIVGEAEQARGLAAQLDDTVDELGVVELFRAEF